MLVRVSGARKRKLHKINLSDTLCHLLNRCDQHAQTQRPLQEKKRRLSMALQSIALFASLLGACGAPSALRQTPPNRSNLLCAGVSHRSRRVTHTASLFIPRCLFDHVIPSLKAIMFTAEFENVAAASRQSIADGQEDARDGNLREPTSGAAGRQFPWRNIRQPQLLQ